MGPHAIDRANWDWDEVATQPVLLPRRRARPRSAQSYLDGIRKAGSSVGAVIEVVAEGVPPGLGAPIYGKLDADLAAALMSINAVKGVEIGDGFAAAPLHRRGERRRDAHGQRRHAGVPVEPRRRHPRRHLDRPAGRRALRRQADLVDPDAAPDRRRATARRPRSSPRAATTPASASAPCRSARRWWPASSPTIPAPPRPGRRGRVMALREALMADTSQSSKPSGPSRAARSSSSPTTTTARTRAT